MKQYTRDNLRDFSFTQEQFDILRIALWKFLRVDPDVVDALEFSEECRIAEKLLTEFNKRKDMLQKVK